MFRTLKSNSPFSAPRDDTARASCGNGPKAISYHFNEAFGRFLKVFPQCIKVLRSECDIGLELDGRGTVGIREEAPASAFKQLIDLYTTGCFLHAARTCGSNAGAARKDQSCARPRNPCNRIAGDSFLGATGFWGITEVRRVFFGETCRSCYKAECRNLQVFPIP